MARNPSDRYPVGGGAGIRPQEAERGHHRRADAVAGLAAGRGPRRRRLGWIAAALRRGRSRRLRRDRRRLRGSARIAAAGSGSARARRSWPCCLWPARPAIRRPSPSAAGVADALITTLSKVPGLTVVSRAATLKYQDRKLEPDAIAAELGATMLVDGRVQRSGDGCESPSACWSPAPRSSAGRTRTTAPSPRCSACSARWRTRWQARCASSPTPTAAVARPADRGTSRPSRTTRRRGRSSSAPTSRTTSTAASGCSRARSRRTRGSPAPMPGWERRTGASTRPRATRSGRSRRGTRSTRLCASIPTTPASGSRWPPSTVEWAA